MVMLFPEVFLKQKPIQTKIFARWIATIIYDFSTPRSIHIYMFISSKKYWPLICCLVRPHQTVTAECFWSNLLDLQSVRFYFWITLHMSLPDPLRENSYKMF